MNDVCSVCGSENSGELCFETLVLRADRPFVRVCGECAVHFDLCQDCGRRMRRGSSGIICRGVRIRKVVCGWCEYIAMENGIDR